MARLPGLYVPGCSHHIIQRGNNRDACFSDEKNYAFYLQQLKISAERSGVAGHVFCIDEQSCAFTGNAFCCGFLCKNDAIAG